MSETNSPALISMDEVFLTFEKQLNELLTAKYVDQSILLGFINLVQSKLHTSIMNKFQPGDDLTLEERDVISATAQLQLIWNKFHYKVVNFFKTQHKILYSEAASIIQSDKQDNESKAKLKPVEIRKLNDNFLKFNSQVFLFYSSILRFIISNYKLARIPPRLFNKFNDIKTKIGSKDLVDVSSPIQRQILLLVYQCLLSLGNLSRNRSLIELSYLKPSLSIKNYYAHQKQLSKSRKAEIVQEYYSKTIEYYRLCILIEPNLCDPYNHIGIIYNSLEEYYDACYWFSRSQSTLHTYEIGHKNLQSALSKDAFKRNLIMNQKEINSMFICLAGYFYRPDVYRSKSKPSFITKNDSFTDTENLFWSKIFAQSIDETFNTNSKLLDRDSRNMFSDHLVILNCFRRLIIISQKNPVEKFDDFYVKYLVKIFNKLVAFYHSVKDKTEDIVTYSEILATFRIIFAILRENKDIRLKFSKHLKLLQTLVNELLGEHKDLDLSTKPSRLYLFVEDVFFKGLTWKSNITASQSVKENNLLAFSDFQDNSFFTGSIGSKDALNGDYSTHVTNEIPNFIDNKGDIEVITNAEVREAAIEIKVKQYENKLRSGALLVLGKKLLEISQDFRYDETKNQFIEVPQKKKVKKSAPPKVPSPNPHQSGSKGSSDAKQPYEKKKSRTEGLRGHEKATATLDKDTLPEVQAPEAPVEEPKIELRINSKQSASLAVPESLAEIESFILQHTSQLHKVTGSSTDVADRDEGLKNMVDSLVLDNNSQENVKTNLNPDVGANMSTQGPALQSVAPSLQQNPQQQLSAPQGQPMPHAPYSVNSSQQQAATSSNFAPQPQFNQPFNSNGQPFSGVEQHQQLPQFYPQYAPGFISQTPFNGGNAQFMNFGQPQMYPYFQSGGPIASGQGGPAFPNFSGSGTNLENQQQQPQSLQQHQPQQQQQRQQFQPQHIQHHAQQSQGPPVPVPQQTSLKPGQGSHAPLGYSQQAYYYNAQQ